ncbi:MAG: PhzF family phenazine biosynthesis protein [Rhodospirillaceae bacterium]|nr:PhzF family phenazine biosynthesis protein [Rhodospirillaceae bacterium]
MRIPIYQVDAFTNRTFGGNPAAVCPLDSWLPDALMQQIATENNLSETAFFVPRGDEYELRWFTPVAEVDLAGHPTLATAWTILNRLGVARDSLVFHTKIGDRLVVSRDGDRLAMDFPSRPPGPRDIGDVAAALRAQPIEIAAARDGFAVFRSEDDVRSLKPDMGKVAVLPCLGLIATAPGKDCDFVSRFFSPQHNIPEDPVTGSAHCTLIPYWAARLGKNEMFARQVSRRGGELWCRHRGERVSIAGQCAPYLEGFIDV